MKKLLLHGRSDEELMTLWVESRRAGRGEVAAFELLWDRHAQATRDAIARVVGPHRSLTDEVFQEAWLEVTRAGSYRPGSFRAFIRTVATRKALDRLAAASVRKTAVDDDVHGLVDALPARAPGPAAGAEAREGAAVVLRIVERMPDAQRIAWTLKYVEELTFEELAEAMGTPVGTAKTRVRLANAFLAESLDAAGVARADLGEEAS